MQIDRSIIGIHGAPRSGTSWLGQLFNSHPNVTYRYQPFFSHAFRGRIDATSSADVICRMFADLSDTADAFVNQIGSARLAHHLPDFGKASSTHLVYKEVRFHHLIEHIIDELPGTRFIGIVRDPRDVLASWFRAPREFRSDWDPIEEWRHARRKNGDSKENWYGFERWKVLSTLFMTLSSSHPHQFRLVRYEELAEAPERVVRSLFRFCGLDYQGQTARFIEDSTSRDDGDPYGVFRRRGTRSKSRLPDEIAEAIERDLHGGSLSQFLAG